MYAKFLWKQVLRPTFYEPIIARASFKRHITPWRSAFKKESFPKAIRFGQKHECQAPSDEDEFAFEKDPWAFLSRGLVMVVSGGPVWASRGEGQHARGCKVIRAQETTGFGLWDIYQDCSAQSLPDWRNVSSTWKSFRVFFWKVIQNENQKIEQPRCQPRCPRNWCGRPADMNCNRLWKNQLFLWLHIDCPEAIYKK